MRSALEGGLRAYKQVDWWCSGVGSGGAGGGRGGTWRGGSNALVATLSHTQLESEKQMNFSRSYDFATGRDCLLDLELLSLFAGQWLENRCRQVVIPVIILLQHNNTHWSQQHCPQPPRRAGIKQTGGQSEPIMESSPL